MEKKNVYENGGIMRERMCLLVGYCLAHSYTGIDGWMGAYIIKLSRIILMCHRTTPSGSGSWW